MTVTWQEKSKGLHVTCIENELGVEEEPPICVTEMEKFQRDIHLSGHFCHHQ